MLILSILGDGNTIQLFMKQMMVYYEYKSFLKPTVALNTQPPFDNYPIQMITGTVIRFKRQIMKNNLIKRGFYFYRPLLKHIKNSGVAHIVLDCTTEKIYDVLKQSQQIGMMSDYHSYLITSLVCFY